MALQTGTYSEITVVNQRLTVYSIFREKLIFLTVIVNQKTALALIATLGLLKSADPLWDGGNDAVFLPGIFSVFQNTPLSTNSLIHKLCFHVVALVRAGIHIYLPGAACVVNVAQARTRL